MAEFGVAVDHANLNRQVVKFSPLIAANAHLKATLSEVANGHLQSQLDDLLPWSFTP